MNIKPTYQVFDIDGRAVTFNHPDHEWVKVVYAMVSAVPNTHRKIPVIKLVRTALDIDLKQAIDLKDINRHNTLAPPNDYHRSVYTHYI